MIFILPFIILVPAFLNQYWFNNWTYGYLALSLGFGILASNRFKSSAVGLGVFYLLAHVTLLVGLPDYYEFSSRTELEIMRGVIYSSAFAFLMTAGFAASLNNISLQIARSSIGVVTLLCSLWIWLEYFVGDDPYHRSGFFWECFYKRHIYCLHLPDVGGLYAAVLHKSLVTRRCWGYSATHRSAAYWCFGTSSSFSSFECRAYPPR